MTLRSAFRGEGGFGARGSRSPILRIKGSGFFVGDLTRPPPTYGKTAAPRGWLWSARTVSSWSFVS